MAAVADYRFNVPNMTGMFGTFRTFPCGKIILFDDGFMRSSEDVMRIANSQDKKLNESSPLRMAHSLRKLVITAPELHLYQEEVVKERLDSITRY